MNKNEFIALLRAHLSVLPPEEQNELLEDYEAHFEFGLQSGKTEEEIVLELGEPAELAKEALGNRYIPQDHVYWYGPDPAGRANAPEPNFTARAENDRPAGNTPAYTGPGLTAVKRRGVFTGVMVYIGLFFLNLIVVPLLLSLWSAFAVLRPSRWAGLSARSPSGWNLRCITSLTRASFLQRLPA